MLAKCKSTDLVYLDPPYQGVCRNRDNRYCPKIDHGEFCDSLAAHNDKACMYVVSYDGRTGEKTYGEPLPRSLGLVHIEVHAGRSTQATLLGRDHDTYESLYLSPALASDNLCQEKGETANAISLAMRCRTEGFRDAPLAAPLRG